MNTHAIVVVGRQWHRPEIRIHVSKPRKEDPGGIRIEMEMEDFIQALAQEAGNPATLLTVGALRERLRNAAEKVVAGMKLESSRAMQ